MVLLSMSGFPCSGMASGGQGEVHADAVLLAFLGEEVVEHVLVLLEHGQQVHADISSGTVLQHFFHSLEDAGGVLSVLVDGLQVLCHHADDVGRVLVGVLVHNNLAVVSLRGAVLDVVPEVVEQPDGHLGEVDDVVHGVQDAVDESLGELTHGGHLLLAYEFVLSVAQVSGTFLDDVFELDLVALQFHEPVAEEDVHQPADDEEIKYAHVPAHVERRGDGECYGGYFRKFAVGQLCLHIEGERAVRHVEELDGLFLAPCAPLAVVHAVAVEGLAGQWGIVEGVDEAQVALVAVEQGRIYHHLTSLPRSLREFFNIKYELDISNSHPLLLNHYLVKYYSIPSNIIREAKAQYHYDVEVVSNILKYSEIDVPLDVLEYIIKTQQGTFYDDFVLEFGDMERSEVKKRVFAQVFYSHITDSYVSKFCKAFIRKYPNVWKVIRAMKVSTDDKLPHTMMKAESLLFRLILKECWSRGYRVVNLHDALVVFDVEANERVTVAELTTIIEQVYHRFGLFSSVKVELEA